MFVVRKTSNYRSHSSVYLTFFKVSLASATRTATLLCLAFILVAVIHNAEAARKRIRRPVSQSSTALTGDQEVSASVNRFKVTRTRGVTSKNTKNEIQTGKANDYKVFFYFHWVQVHILNGQISDWLKSRI